MYILLTVRKCNVTGEIGFVPESCETFYNDSDSYVVGTAIGHDILDHMPNETGTLEQELCALGSVIWRGYKDLRGLGSDLQSTFSDAARNGNGEACACPESKVEHAVQWSLDYVWDDLCESLQKYPQDFGLDDDAEEEEEEARDLDKLWNKTNLLHWLSFGYRRAQTRYAEFEPYQLSDIVQTINLACDKASRNIIMEGQQFMLEFDIMNNWARVEEV